MAKGKSISTKSGAFAKGGNTKMFGKQFAGPQKPSTTATASKSGSGGKFAKGGGKKMFGFAPAGKSPAGKTSAR